MAGQESGETGRKAALILLARGWTQGWEDSGGVLRVHWGEVGYGTESPCFCLCIQPPLSKSGLHSVSVRQPERPGFTCQLNHLMNLYNFLVFDGLFQASMVSYGSVKELCFWDLTAKANRSDRVDLTR